MKNCRIGLLPLSRSSISRLFCVLPLMLVLVGCLPTQNSVVRVEKCLELPPLGSEGRLSVFLNLQRTPGAQLNLEIGGVEVLSGSEWLPLLSETRVIETGSGGTGQYFLGSRIVPSGTYSAVRLNFNGATRGEAGAVANFTINVPVVELQVESAINLSGHSNRLIFINWQVEQSLNDNSVNKSAFNAINDLGVIVSSNLAYISCPEIDAVYIVRTDINRVVGSISITGRPTYIYADNVNKNLFVLAADDSSITVVHMVSQVITDSFKIPFVSEPIIMTIDPEAKYAFVLDRRGTLVKLDLQNGNMVARNRIGQMPNYIAYLADLEKLAVSSTLDNMIYFVNPDGLEVLETVHIEGQPAGFAATNDLLYVAESDLNNLSIYDLGQRKTVRRIPVGRNPGRVVVDQERAYVTNTGSSSLTVITGTHYQVGKEVAVGEYPLEMAVADYQRFLYVANGNCGGGVSIVDLSSNQTVGEIELGARPLSISVIQ